MSPSRPWLWGWVGSTLLVVDGSALVQNTGDGRALLGVLVGSACLAISWLVYRSERD